MKKIFLIVVLGLLIGCNKPIEKDANDKFYNEYMEAKKRIEFTCQINRVLAQSVMKKRQYKNLTLEEDLSSTVNPQNQEINNVIRKAYQYPRESSGIIKEARIREFSDRIHSDCYRDEVNKEIN